MDDVALQTPDSQSLLLPGLDSSNLPELLNFNETPTSIGSTFRTSDDQLLPATLDDTIALGQAYSLTAGDMDVSNNFSDSDSDHQESKEREEFDSLTGETENQTLVNPEISGSPSPGGIQQPLVAGSVESQASFTDVPFPTQLFEELPTPDADSNNMTQNLSPSIFTGSALDVGGSSVSLTFDKDLFTDPQGSKTFFWKSDDSVLGTIEATIETGPAVGDLWDFTPATESQPARLVFTGSGGGATFSGDITFGPIDTRGTVEVTMEGQGAALSNGVTSVQSATSGPSTTYSVWDMDPNDSNCDPCECECPTANSKDLYLERGEFFHKETDLSIPGRPGAAAALDYSFNREYQSRRENDGPLGFNWSHRYFDESLEVQIDGSVIHKNGLDREDRYLLNDTENGFIAPPELFTRLEQSDDGSYALRFKDGTVRSFDTDGKLTEIRDRNDNFISLQYNDEDQLVQVIDTLGRPIEYRYLEDGINAGRLQEIEDFFGRKVKFTYDDNGDLVEVTSPTVTDTPNDNDFPEGKTTRYTYSSGLGGRLDHNLLTITRPNEVANGGPPVLINEYSPGFTGFAGDKVISQIYGGTNASGVEAGGEYTYTYEELATGGLGDPNQTVSRVTEVDRNGNKTEYEFNALGYPVVRREFTKGLREDEPEFFETGYQYNADGRLIAQTEPEGNEMLAIYDADNTSRFAQGNRTFRQELPGARGGDQTEINTQTIYDPIYQQASITVDPRGLDESFTPAIPEPEGRSQAERYATRYFFDYQEGDAAVILPLLADELGVSQADVQTQLDAAGIQLGLGDLNLDGEISTSIAGNVVRMDEPSVVLLPGSNQAAIEGDQLQEIITLYRYNDFGQQTSMVDPEGNVHVYEYFAESDPDGDGTTSAPPLDGRLLDDTTGGYLAAEIRDAAHFAGANNGNGALPTAIRMDYTYDPVGNLTSETDGRGIRTDYVVNELNQVVRTIRSADAPNVGDGDPSEPLELLAFAYIEDIFYDFNDNVVMRQVEDRGDTSNTGGVVDYTYTYDILDNLITETQEVDVDTTLVTQYRYDANENLALTLSPEGNATTALYDERDLLFVSTRGALAATADTLSAPVGMNPDPDQPYNVRGGIPCQCTTYNYDLNQNVIGMVDSDDTDLSALNNGTIGSTDQEGDVTRYVYDGYDRLVATIDPVGNRTELTYDPASNVVREETFGPIDGPSPIDNSGTDSVLLSAMVYLHDELNRKFQQDQLLFVSDGVSTVRPPEISDGGLTPDDGRVTMRYEYDRKSRQTFSIEDDGDTYETQYDGANRQIKTIDPEGNTVEFAYDDNDNLIETKETDVAQVTGVADEIFLTTYFYDSLNRLQQTTDNIGQTMVYRYDSRDNLVAMADAQGPVTGETIDRRAFSEGALTVNAINDFGNVARYFYDGINRKVREEQILTVSGDGDGIHIGANIFGVKDIVGEEESFTPTPDLTQGGGDGIIRTGYVYDDNSLLSALVDDQGNVTVYLYDNLNRQVTQTKGLTVDTASLNKDLILGDREIITPTAATINNPEVISETLINNQLAKVKAGLDNIALLFPPLAGRVDDNPPTTIVYGYSPDDNVLILEDENDSETFTRYDALNRRIATRIFRSGQNDSFVGDPIFAPNPVADPSNPSDTFPGVIGTNINDYQYDGLSRLTRATDNNDPDDASDDSVVTYAYDSLSRVIEETQQIGSLPAQAISSAWEAENLRVGLTYPNGRRLNYTYDGLDRLKTITDDGETDVIVEYDYIGVNRVLERRFPTNGTRMTYLSDDGNTDEGYDGLRRTIQLRHLRSDNSLIVGFQYDYDRMNNKLSEVKLHDPSNNETYNYDSAYRLINFERPDSNAIDPLHSDWTLDGVGNWQQVDGETREHSSFNELIQRDGTTLDFDDNGNQTDNGTFTFEWDAQNRLRKITRKSDGAVVATYNYDAKGRRVRKEVTNSGSLDGTTDFYYDGWQVLEEHDVTDMLTQQYVYGDSYLRELLLLDQNLDGDDSAISSSDQRLFYHQDSLYSAFALTDETGTIVEGYQYDAYGRPTVFSPGVNDVIDFGSDDVISVGGSSELGNPYLRTGHRLDNETNFYYYGYRYFSSDIGRWFSRDPIGEEGGLNLYGFNNHNPENSFDLLGDLAWWAIPLGLITLERAYRLKECSDAQNETCGDICDPFPVKSSEQKYASVFPFGEVPCGYDCECDTPDCPPDTPVA